MKSLTEYLEECLNYELSKIDESLSVFDGCEILLIDTIELLENNLDKNVIKHKFENLFFNELNIICIFMNSIKNFLFLNISNRYIVTYKIKNILKEIK